MELISQLTEQLGITTDQAKGGAGLIMGMAKDKLSGDDFNEVSNSIPDMGDLLSSAPSDGIGGMLGKMASSAMGGDSKLGALAGLAGGFDKLNMDSGMIMKFLPIVMSFVQSKGGDKVKNILSNVLK